MQTSINFYALSDIFFNDFLRFSMLIYKNANQKRLIIEIFLISLSVY